MTGLKLPHPKKTRFIDPVLGNVFGKVHDKLFPEPDAPPAPPVMPDEEEIKRQQRILAARASRSGRASTILSQPAADAFGS